MLRRLESFLCILLAGSLFFGLHIAHGEQSDLSKVELPECPIGEKGAPALMNPGIESGGLCRGVCGVDCDRCEKIKDIEVTVADYEDSQLVCVYPGSIECKTHQGCRDHDACYDRCAERGYKIINDQCHRDCDDECFKKWGGQCVAWADVLGPIQPAYERAVAQPEFNKEPLQFFWGEPQQKIVLKEETWKTWAVDNGVKFLELEIKFKRSGNSLTMISPAFTSCSGNISDNHFCCDWVYDPTNLNYGKPLEPESDIEIDFAPDGKSFKGVLNSMQTEFAWEGERIS